MRPKLWKSHIVRQADKEFLYSSRQLPEVFKLPLIIAFSCKVHFFVCGGEQSFYECVWETLNIWAIVIMARRPGATILFLLVSSIVEYWHVHFWKSVLLKYSTAIWSFSKFVPSKNILTYIEWNIEMIIANVKIFGWQTILRYIQYFVLCLKFIGQILELKMVQCWINNQYRGRVLNYQNIYGQYLLISLIIIISKDPEICPKQVGSLFLNIPATPYYPNLTILNRAH